MKLIVVTFPFTDVASMTVRKTDDGDNHLPSWHSAHKLQCYMYTKRWTTAHLLIAGGSAGHVKISSRLIRYRTK